MKTVLKLSMLAFCSVFLSCGEKDEKKMEGLTYEEQQVTMSDSIGNSLKRGEQLTTSSNTVLLTGIDHVRLIPTYKVRPKTDRSIEYDEGTTYQRLYTTDEDGRKVLEEDDFAYFMPGMDIVYGYNMVNLGHYDIATGKLTHFFDKPALIRTVYFPGVKPDSLFKQRVTRNYFLVSAYDEDTNRDSLVNRKDMRKLYHFDEINSKKTPLIPNGFSPIRSTYDYKNDIMYIYARYDSNKNGTPERKEPINIFYIKLNEPTIVRRMI